MLQLGNSLDHYAKWPSPTVIISDGPYAVAFDWDKTSVSDLPDWYKPHVEAWSKSSTAQTTLWFWNTEIGWATVHPILISCGWQYRGLNIWNKGVGHIAGNINTVTIRKFPTVTEVCAHYIRRSEIRSNGKTGTFQDWIRREWIRSGLPFSRANDACGVKNAASRKYLTADSLWYFPPAEQFDKLAKYANIFGKPEGRPYFSFDGVSVISGSKWESLRAKFNCPFGVTNVWNCSSVHGAGRIKTENGKIIHPNQKPLSLMRMIIESSSDPEDVVWEPFVGTDSGLVAASQLNRRGYGAEINEDYFNVASQRLNQSIIGCTK